MAKFAKHTNRFTAGELSPRYWGATDTEQYQQGCREILNKIVRKQGGAARRPGSVYCGDGIYSNGSRVYSFGTYADRLIPFKFSRTDASLVMLTAGNNGANAYGIAIYVPALRKWIAPTISLTSGYKAFAGWSTQAQLDEIQYAQNGDVLVLVSKSNPPIYILRTDSITYTVYDMYSVRTAFPSNTITRAPAYGGSSTIVLEKISPSAAPSDSAVYYNFPYRPIRITTSGGVSASGTTGSITVTISGGPKWQTKYVGTIIRCTKSGTTGFFRIDSLNADPAIANCTVLKTLGGTSAFDSFEEQDFGVDTDAWPRCVWFHDQRIWYANVTDKPNTFWASQVGDFVEMMIVRPADDANFSSLSNDRPFSFALSSTSVDDICWGKSGHRSLFIGTAGGEWIGQPSGDNILGPLNPNFKEETEYGSKPIQAIDPDGAMVFVDSTGQNLREFVFNRDEDAYRANDLSYFADHMIRKGIDIYSSYSEPAINELTIQRGNNNIVFVRDSNFMLHTIGKQRDAGVLAWSTVNFGGVGDSDGNPPLVKSVCAIPSESAGDDDVYVLVSRYLNSTTKVYLEKIGREFIGPSLDIESNDIQDHPVYMDSAILLYGLENRLFLAKYASSINADDAISSTTGTGTNSPTASNGLVLTGSTVKYVSYPAANVASLVNTGTIFCEFTPNYTGSPSTAKFLYVIAKGGTAANQVVVYHDTLGLLQVEIRDSSGNWNLGISGITFSPVSGQKYSLVVTWNASAGRSSVYLNGIKLSQNFNVACTRTSDVDIFYVGTDRAATNTSNFTINALAISSDETSIPDYTLPFGFTYNLQALGVHHFYGANEVLADGFYQGSRDIETNGLSSAASYTLGGFQYDSRITLMDLEAGSILGSAQGEMKRAHEVTIRLERTCGIEYGHSLSNLYEVDFSQDLNYDTSAPIPLYTGDRHLLFPMGHSRNLTPIFQQSKPFPCAITSVVTRGLTND